LVEQKIKEESSRERTQKKRSSHLKYRKSYERPITSAKKKQDAMNKIGQYFSGLNEKNRDLHNFLKDLDGEIVETPKEIIPEKLPCFEKNARSTAFSFRNKASNNSEIHNAKVQKSQSFVEASSRRAKAQTFYIRKQEKSEEIGGKSLDFSEKYSLLGTSRKQRNYPLKIDDSLTQTPSDLKNKSELNNINEFTKFEKNLLETSGVNSLKISKNAHNYNSEQARIKMELNSYRMMQNSMEGFALSGERTLSRIKSHRKSPSLVTLHPSSSNKEIAIIHSSVYNRENYKTKFSQGKKYPQSVINDHNSGANSKKGIKSMGGLAGLRNVSYLLNHIQSRDQKNNKRLEVNLLKNCYHPHNKSSSNLSTNQSMNQKKSAWSQWNKILSRAWINTALRGKPREKAFNKQNNLTTNTDKFKEVVTGSKIDLINKLKMEKEQEILRAQKNMKSENKISAITTDNYCSIVEGYISSIKQNNPNYKTYSDIKNQNPNYFKHHPHQMFVSKSANFKNSNSHLAHDKYNPFVFEDDETCVIQSERKPHDLFTVETHSKTLIPNLFVYPQVPPITQVEFSVKDPKYSLKNREMQLNQQKSEEKIHEKNLINRTQNNNLSHSSGNSKERENPAIKFQNPSKKSENVSKERKKGKRLGFKAYESHLMESLRKRLKDQRKAQSTSELTELNEKNDVPKIFKAARKAKHMYSQLKNKNYLTSLNSQHSNPSLNPTSPKHPKPQTKHPPQNQPNPKSQLPQHSKANAKTKRIKTSPGDKISTLPPNTLEKHNFKLQQKQVIHDASKQSNNQLKNLKAKTMENTNLLVIPDQTQLRLMKNYSYSGIKQDLNQCVYNESAANNHHNLLKNEFAGNSATRSKKSVKLNKYSHTHTHTCSVSDSISNSGSELSQQEKMSPTLFLLPNSSSHSQIDSLRNPHAYLPHMRHTQSQMSSRYKNMAKSECDYDFDQEDMTPALKFKKRRNSDLKFQKSKRKTTTFFSSNKTLDKMFNRSKKFINSLKEKEVFLSVQSPLRSRSLSRKCTNRPCLKSSTDFTERQKLISS
jgi:hypothetical protein